ncbi:Sterile alpha motif domain-containing 3 [Labeo rohita]|uniref:Sterile alpha motif domain-containing 3 n=1 Tax=Labeo rohita TaxID=84645 RepID=A0A498P6L6_LABRO|nr:Sterile alpha motif domain-containing 3 [Labeo rohita]
MNKARVFQYCALLLRVVVSADEARRVHLSQVPESVDALIDALKEKLQLQGDFTLQFEDPDFANALCTLSDISEIPRDRAVLHIKWKIASQLDNSDSQSLGSISSLDTASLNSPVHTSTNPSPTTSSNLRSTSVWPSPFPIPPLSHDVELKLRKANEAYEKTKIGIDVTRDIKTDILDKITQVTFNITAYPRPHEVESIAVALISKYPCLKENDGNGYEGWLTSIKNRFSNFRAKLRVAGCSEVSINSKSKGDGDMTYTLKRVKRGEINHCPNHPNEHDDASLEEQRMLLVEASKKARVDDSLIRVKMDLTFSLRRREVVEEQPMVMVIQNRWPALFFKEQIVEEFFRITNKNLLGTFRAAVEKYRNSFGSTVPGKHPLERT